MDLSVTRENVRVSETLLDTVSDHPVDCDIILPDYCPDIARILKTEGCASIDQKVLESISQKTRTLSGALRTKCPLATALRCMMQVKKLMLGRVHELFLSTVGQWDPAGFLSVARLL